MSYCVNCGVELAESEKYCPLCHTEVVNPNAPWQKPEAMPYPARQERRSHIRVDRRYLAALTGLLLLIPLLTTLLLDLLEGDGVSWSGNVLGAILVLFIWLVLPFFFRRFHALILLPLDALALLVYLYGLQQINGGAWFFGLGLPLVLFCSAGVGFGYWFLIAQRRRFRLLHKAALLLVDAGLLTVAIEAVVDVYRLGAPRLTWSIIVLTPCLLLALTAHYIARHPQLAAEIRRRLFF